MNTNTKTKRLLKKHKKIFLFSGLAALAVVGATSIALTTTMLRTHVPFTTSDLIPDKVDPELQNPGGISPDQTPNDSAPEFKPEQKPSEPIQPAPEFKPEQKPSEPIQPAPEFKPDIPQAPAPIIVPSDGTYEDNQGFVFTKDGVLVGYKGTSETPILTKELTDKHDPSIKVTIARIEESAFIDKKLKSITIPATVQKIGSFAFANTQLEELIFEENSVLQMIGYNAFENHKLKTISLPSTIEKIYDFAFYTKNYATENQSVDFNGNEHITEIARGTFLGMRFSEVELPKNVKNLGRFAFWYDNWKEPLTTTLTVKSYYQLTSSHGDDWKRETFGYYKSVKLIVLTYNR